MQGWKTRDWKTRHQTAGVENAGVAQYGKPKSPLFNIVATATRTNVSQKDFMQLEYFYCIIKAELYLPILRRLGLNVSYPVLTRLRETDSLVACTVL